ncbi:4Fe-4S dicluster domain-containing protein [Candidatus Bathyarchaeota archaeon]|nr:4Fe-4S dicluster domain-containing protein [Candidatus Bathyarchaeota archaeon]
MDRILLRFSEENVEEPITSQVILELGIPMRIVTATVNSLGGDILVEVPAVHVEKIVKAFKAKGVIVTFPKLIEVDCDKCYDCGACYALCPVDAISYEEDYSVVFDEKTCIGSPCGLCVDACPARAIKLVEQNRNNRK